MGIVGVLSTSCPELPAINAALPFHNLGSVDWHYCALASGPKFGWVTPLAVIDFGTEVNQFPHLRSELLEI